MSICVITARLGKVNGFICGNNDDDNLRHYRVSSPSGLKHYFFPSLKYIFSVYYLLQLCNGVTAKQIACYDTFLN